jgi:FKBP-type peptidyl-prolyl cis-trans isomerase 2
MLIPGFENGLIGMSIGESKTVEIEPENAYGDYKNEMVQEVPLSQVPEGVQVGDMLTGQSQYGPMQVTVKEVTSETVILDMNHPLAGKKLIFDLEVVSVN